MKASPRRRARAALLAALLGAGPAFADAPDAYVQALRQFWGDVYGGGGTEIYCGDRFDRETGRGLNVEHVYPMSWVATELRCGSRDQCRERSDAFIRIETDMHNMFPSRPELNSARGSMPFAEIDGEERRFGACDFEKDDRGRRVEPRPAARGEIARAMFYMQQTYGLPIYPRQGETLLRWHRADPPDDAERRRNDAIARLQQGHRNPFIDNPAQADRLRFEAPRR